MNRMSRAGRKAVMFGILRARFKMGKNDSVTVGYMARKMGLKSSTYLKKLADELCKENDEIQVMDFSWGRAFKYKPLVQTDFFDRVIKVNGLPVKPRDMFESGVAQ